jgi:hypothetical protein
MAETMAATMTMRRQTCPESCAVAVVGSMSIFLLAPAMGSAFASRLGPVER